MKFIERENEIIKTVSKLLGCKIIVVGGYAVSARAKHRFSVDCDIVISKESLEKIISILGKENYKKTIAKGDLDGAYQGKFIRYMKEVDGLPVSIDLLINSLVSRATNAAWSFDYILKNSDKAIIAGVENSIECLVPTKELLIAFKLHSGRKTDLRDVIMLENSDWSLVKSHLVRGSMIILKKRVELMIEELDDKNLHDSLKGVFELSGDAGKLIQTTKKNLTALLKGI